MADVKFTVALTEKVSAPAKSAEKGLKGVEKGLKGVDTGKLEKGMAKAGKGADSFASSLKGLAVAFGVMKAVDFAKGAIVGFAKLGVDSVVAKENAKLALTQILGDAKKADAALAQVHGLSNFLGQDPGPLTDALVKLTNKGHSTADAMRILQGSLDLSTMPGGKKLEEIVQSFTELDSKGKFAEDALAKFSEMGLKRDTFLSVLAKHLGTDAKGAALALKNGTVDVGTAQKVALAAITQQTGKALGGAKKAQSQSIGGLIENFESLPKRWAAAVNGDKALVPLKNLMGKVADLLNPDSKTGQKFVATLGKVADAIGNLADQVDFDVLADSIETAADALSKATDATVAFGSEFGSSFKAAAKFIGLFDDKQKAADPTSRNWAKTLGTVGKVLGIASPSKVFAKEVGQYIPAGVAKGVNDNASVYAPTRSRSRLGGRSPRSRRRCSAR